MDVTQGKLKNTKSGDTLAFSVNPAEYHLDQVFEYRAHSCLGVTEPMVNFQSSGPALLSFKLVFDSDLGSPDSVAKVFEFVSKARTVDPESRSVPSLQFRMGKFDFKGFLKRYRYTAQRFDSKGEPTAVCLEADMVADSSVEGGAS